MALSPLYEKAKIKFPQRYNPIEIFSENSINKKDLDVFRKKAVDALDAAMEGSNKDIYCLRSSDINRLLRSYDTLILHDTLKAAAEQGHNTFGVAEDESDDNDLEYLSSQLTVDFPNTKLIIYKKHLKTLEKKLKNHWMYTVLTLIEYQIVNLLISYYGNSKYNGYEDNKELFALLLKNLFSLKVDKYIIERITVSIIQEKKLKNITSTTTKSTDKTAKKSESRPIKKSSTKKKSPVSRSPSRSPQKKKISAKKKKESPKKKTTPVGRTSPRKRKTVKSPKKSGIKSPSKPKNKKKYPKGLKLGEFRKEAKERGLDKEETKEAWKQYKAGKL